FGWEMAFIGAGVVGFLWLLLWLPFYDVPERIKRLSKAEYDLINSDAEEPAPEKKPSWLDLLKYRQTWSFITAKFITDPVWWFFLIWLPDYFSSTRGLHIKESWVHLVTIYFIITILSIVGGWFTGYLNKSGWS